MTTQQLFVCETPYNNLANECRIMMETFYPNWRIQLTSRKEDATLTVMFHEGLFSIQMPDYVQQFELKGVKNLFEPEVSYKNALKRALYDCFVMQIGYEPPWGMLQGIRPTKLVFKYLRDLVEEPIHWSKELVDSYRQQIKARLYDTYRVTEPMAELALTVASHEMASMPNKGDTGISLYFMIPFCPTRCSYCSFPSNCLSDYSIHVDGYVDRLIDEFVMTIEALEIIQGIPAISTVYIGGGTPTSLTPEQLERLLAAIDRRVDVTTLKEYTVEAGRPDTITREKLQLMRTYGVNRISINPQTMHQKTLERIGRDTSVEDIGSCMAWAKEVGFERINMDIILGLPEETMGEVEDTIHAIMPMGPSEVTVHTMSLKRGSRLLEETDGEGLSNKEDIESMVELSRNLLTDRYKMQPYYLYRQKHILGAHENIGYYLGDTPGIYNIEMIEEVRTILAFGAGASSKVVWDHKRLERVENVKNLNAYMARYQEMAQRKIQALKDKNEQLPRLR